jgi:hypothetical protein
MIGIKSIWYPAIKVRNSIRNFDKNKSLTEDIKSQLQETCLSFRPFTGVRVEYISEPPDDIFAHALGFYGNIKNAPSYLAFIGDMTDANVQEKMGYTGEGIILEATALGLGTCWNALTYKSKSVLSMIKLDKNEKLMAVSPVGYALEQAKGDSPKVITSEVTHRRKNLDSIVLGLKESQQPEWALAAAEAARLAPSAINRQPWLFNIQNESISVSVRNSVPEFNVSKRLDCGIAMMHIECGAQIFGARGHWEFLKQPQVARFILVR